MPDTTSLFDRAMPVLASLDIAASLDFFHRLGFKTHDFGNSNYGIAIREHIEIHFWLCADRHIAENTSWLKAHHRALPYAEIPAALGWSLPTRAARHRRIRSAACRFPTAVRRSGLPRRKAPARSASRCDSRMCSSS